MAHTNHPQTRRLTNARTLILRLTLASLLVGTLSILEGCSHPGKPDSAPMAAISGKNWGVDLNNIGPGIQPGDDFYRYVNQGWLAKAKIPQGLSALTSFSAVTLSTEQQLETLIQDLLASKPAVGSPEQQVTDLYRSFMNVQGREALGFDSLKPELAGILKAKDRRELASRMAKVGYKPLFDIGSIIDWGQPDRYILVVDQSGLGMPSRDFYLTKGEPFASHRQAYLGYIEGVLQRAGITDAGPKAKAVFEFEVQLAKLRWSPEQLRDLPKSYHVLDVDQLPRYAPGFDWPAFLAGNGFGDVKRIQLFADAPIQGMAKLYGKTSLETLRAYVAYHYLNNHAPLLSKAWVDAHFDLFSRRLLGIAEQRPLEKQALDTTNRLLGEPLGKLYVERYFPKAYKAKMDEMVGFIVQAMKQRLEKLDWMDEPTRQEALKKLAGFHVKIGYPEKWHDYSTVKIDPKDVLGNSQRLAAWARADARAKLDEPVRTWEFSSTPQTVDAYYSPDRNEIVFLAALLQPPFFNADADPAVNFGSIGAAVGHEIGHGFDDQGRQFDGTGKMRNWWTEAARQKFQEKTRRLVAQYGQYSPIPGVRINGQLTLGENIGDMAGITTSYAAYQNYAAANYPGGQPPVLDGFTGNQRFFLGFGQLWRNITTDDEVRLLSLTNPHSPGEFRTNGVVRNFDPWYEAFGVKETDALFLPKAQRISIW